MGILGRAIGIVFGNFLAFSPIIVPVLAVTIVLALSLDIGRVLFQDPFNSLSIVWMGYEILIVAVLSAALMYGTYQSMLGRPVNAGDCVRNVARFMSVAFTIGVAKMVLTLLGFVALFVPAIIIGCGLFVAVPAAVLGRGNALSKSWSLTQGYKGKIFGLTLVVSIFLQISSFGLNLTLGAAKDYAALAVIFAFIDVAHAVVMAICSVIVYHDLRVIKEGSNMDEIAEELVAVFD